MIIGDFTLRYSIIVVIIINMMNIPNLCQSSPMHGVRHDAESAETPAGRLRYPSSQEGTEQQEKRRQFKFRLDRDFGGARGGEIAGGLEVFIFLIKN